MPAIITPQDFVAKWRETALTERSSSRPHFTDRCALLAPLTLTAADRTGTWFILERGAGRASGGHS